MRHLGLGHRPVILLARAAGSADWTFEGTRLTQRHGVVKFPVDPAADSAYRLVFLGTARLQPAHSGVVRFAARPDVSITAAPAAIMIGESTTVSGVVTSQGAGLGGVTVEGFWGTKVGRPTQHRQDRDRHHGRRRQRQASPTLRGARRSTACGWPTPTGCPTP